MTTPRAHLVIPTHTPRHLAACLFGVARQTQPPRTVTVTTDGDSPAIAQTLDACWPRVASALATRGRPLPTLRHVARPHQGEARLNQVRNNALRCLDDAGELHERDLVVLLDGDTVLAPDAIEQHLRDSHADIVIPFRINLTEPETAALPPDAWPPDGSTEALLRGPAFDLRRAALARRQGRYERQALARRLLGNLAVKPHKPKLLGGHHAVRVAALRAVNGYDEAFVGYGYDDDDLSRRLLALKTPLHPRPRVRIAVADILAWHLWHPSRAPQRPTDSPGYERFRQWPWPVACLAGWATPAAQPAPTVRTVAAATASPFSAAVPE